MVLHPRQPKTTLSTATTTASVASFNRVISPPIREPLVFNDANRYEVWHSAMREEIQALCANRTWTLVSFHPSMNVVGSWWVYKIKCISHGSIERYKVCLVARGFTQQEGIDYSKPLVLLSNRQSSYLSSPFLFCVIGKLISLISITPFSMAFLMRRSI